MRRNSYIFMILKRNDVGLSLNSASECCVWSPWPGPRDSSRRPEASSAESFRTKAGHEFALRRMHIAGAINDNAPRMEDTIVGFQ